MTAIPPTSALGMLSSADLLPAKISPLPGGFSASLWRVDHAMTRHPVAVIKRAATNRTRAIAERAALTHLTHDAPPDLRAILPHVLATREDHDTRALLLSWVGHRSQRTLTLDAALDHEQVHDHILERLGEAIATMHSVTVPRGGEVKLSDDPLPLPDRLLDMARRAVHKSARRGGKNHSVRHTLDRALAALEEILCAKEPILDAYPGRFIHRDLRPANIILGGDSLELTGIVDFERSAAGHPAWDFVKLRAWLFNRWPHTHAPFSRGYARVTPPPDNTLIQLFELHEALTTLAYFRDRHDTYTLEALETLRRLGIRAEASRFFI